MQPIRNEGALVGFPWLLLLNEVSTKACVSVCGMSFSSDSVYSVCSWPTRRTAAAQNVCEEQQWVEGDGDKTVFKKLWPVSFF